MLEAKQIDLEIPEKYDLLKSAIVNQYKDNIEDAADAFFVLMETTGNYKINLLNELSEEMLLALWKHDDKIKELCIGNEAVSVRIPEKEIMKFAKNNPDKKLIETLVTLTRILLKHKKENDSFEGLLYNSLSNNIVDKEKVNIQDRFGSCSDLPIDYFLELSTTIKASEKIMNCIQGSKSRFKYYYKISAHHKEKEIIDKVMSTWSISLSATLDKENCEARDEWYARFKKKYPDKCIELDKFKPKDTDIEISDIEKVNNCWTPLLKAFCCCCKKEEPTKVISPRLSKELANIDSKSPGPRKSFDV